MSESGRPLPARIWAVTLLALLREAARAAVSPLRLLLYLPNRRRIRAEAVAALAAEPSGASGEDLRRFLAALPLRGARTGKPRVFLSAGEHSGETHVVELMHAVARAGIDASWSGFGGERMAAEGCVLVRNLVDHATMWIGDALKKVPMFVSAYAQFIWHLEVERPELVVLTDNPGFHVILASAARARGIPVLYFITPQYWAWGPWRMRRFRANVDGALSILPFEPAFYRRSGVPCEFVGNPLIDRLSERALDEGFLADVRSRPTLVVLPGSRKSEIATHMPGLKEVLARFRRAHPDARVLIPHRDPERLALIRAALVPHDPGIETVEGHVTECLAGARLALVKSGTGTLESCALGTPTVIFYKLHGGLQRVLHRWFLSVPYIGVPNLIAGREAVPEFCFGEDRGWEDVLATLEELWADGPRRSECLASLAEVRRRLGEPGSAERAARWVVAAIRR